MQTHGNIFITSFFPFQLKSYAQSNDDTIKSYSITISDSVTDEGYLGLFAINGSKIIFFKERLLASGKKFVIGVWLGTSAITFALILHIGRVSAKTANALNKVLWDLTELVDKIIGLPQKFVGFIKKGPQAPTPNDNGATTLAPPDISSGKRKSSVDKLNTLPRKSSVDKLKDNTLPRKKRKESTASTLEEFEDTTIGGGGSLIGSDNEMEMETMSMSIDFRRKSSAISVSDFPQAVSINIENADEETANADDGSLIQDNNENADKDKDGDDSSKLAIDMESTACKDNASKETVDDSSKLTIDMESMETDTSDASKVMIDIENTDIAKPQETTTNTSEQGETDSSEDTEMDITDITLNTTYQEADLNLKDMEANGSAPQTGNCLFSTLEKPAVPTRDSESRRSVQFNIDEEKLNKFVIENSDTKEYEKDGVYTPDDECYNTIRSTKSLMSVTSKRDRKLQHAFNHFAKSIQRFSTLSTMIVIGFFFYDIYIYTRFARRLSYDWLLLFPFPFWTIVVTIINVIAFIITESILFCSRNNHTKQPKRTVFYKVVSDFFITMSATTVPIFVFFHLFWSILALSAFSIRLLSSATFYLPLVIFGLWLLAVISNILKNWRNLIFLPHKGKKSDSRLRKVLRFIGRFLYPLIPLFFLPFWVLLLATLNFFSDFMLEVVNLEEQSLLVVFGIIIIITIAARKIAKNCQPQYTDDDDEEDELEDEM